MSDDKFVVGRPYGEILNPVIDRNFGLMSRRLMALPEDLEVPPSDKPAYAPDEVAPVRPRLKADPGMALARAAFEASIPKNVRRKIMQGEGLAVVITVPSAAWVKPVANYVDELTESSRYARNGSERRDQPTEGNEAVAASLADGNKVIGISQDPKRFLPSLLVASADMQVAIKAPDAAALAAAMRMSLRGRVPADLPVDLGAQLDFPELMAAIRKNSSPTEAVGRLREFISAALASDDEGEPLPKLEDAHFYGAARDWALDLAKDISDAKRSGDFSSLPRGALFAGGPGTGKTILAKLISRACNVPFINASMGDLFAGSDGYLGGVIKANRAVFARAAALSPCILFLDELDALPNRAAMDGRAREWWNTLISDFLILIASAPKGVIILAATNANPAEHIDAALLRPGRLERVFQISPPKTAAALESVLRFHLRGALASDDLMPLARISLGATPATIMDHVRTAQRAARTAGRDMVLGDLAQAVCPPDLRSKDDRRLIALHEAAHICVAVFLGLDAVRSVSIVPTGESDGRVAFHGFSEAAIHGREQIERVVQILLAGRAAETVFAGAPSGGAGGVANSDLALATRLIASIHGSLGLADTLVFRSAIEDVASFMTFDADFRKLVEDDLRRLSAKTELLVRQRRSDIAKVAELLLDRRYLTADEVRAVLKTASHERISP